MAEAARRPARATNTLLGLFLVKANPLDDLVRFGALTRQAATFLDAVVASGRTVLVAAGT